MLSGYFIEGKSTKDLAIALYLSKRQVQRRLSNGLAEFQIRANAYKILEDTLNLRDVRIYDTVQDADGKEQRVLNQKATTLAQQKQQAIKDAFREWIWKDPERRQTLVAQYHRRPWFSPFDRLFFTGLFLHFFMLSTRPGILDQYSSKCYTFYV